MFINSAKISNNAASYQTIAQLQKKIDEGKKEQPKLIGIYGGTFDPIHNAHLAIVLAAKSELQLDEVRILPCYKPVHGKSPVASAHDRLRMVELAVADHKGIIVDDCEYQRETPTRTMDTLKILKENFPKVTCCLIIGMDNLLSFTTWYQWEKIFDWAHIVVAERPGYVLPKEGKIIDVLKARSSDDKGVLQTSRAGAIVFFSAPQLELSSSEIREALDGGKESNKIPPKVQEYIKQQHLYEKDSHSHIAQKQNEYTCLIAKL
jgi:nicotinate-nucleotide adenylyltransferase